MSILISKSRFQERQPLLPRHGSIWSYSNKNGKNTLRALLEEWSNWERERVSCKADVTEMMGIDMSENTWNLWSSHFFFYTLEHHDLHSNSLVGLNFKWSWLRIMNKAIKYCLNNLLLHGTTSIIAEGKRTSSICIWVIDGQFTMFVFYFLGRNERALILLLTLAYKFRW